ncbi:Hypothetical protein SRAE_1000273400 [Strongyloides ratti]|uniref:Uncharacterized protein n=1 Tax=Strongyloides ratti TaxID=34506 RepID=A0A090LAB6_STRRB|nr:Hypothetical protein SRAE_1000273400 [Strongyloides ratti]CEF64480.1 Hypothetical protein SRAE_1000273400 [Strongyloides ratti]
MPFQSLTYIDLTGVVLCFTIFLLFLYILSLIINYTLVLDDDEATEFEKFGANNNFKFGRRPLSVVKYKVHRYNKMLAEKGY